MRRKLIKIIIILLLFIVMVFTNSALATPTKVLTDYWTYEISGNLNTVNVDKLTEKITRDINRELKELGTEIETSSDSERIKTKGTSKSSEQPSNSSNEKINKTEFKLSGDLNAEVSHRKIKGNPLAVEKNVYYMFENDEIRNDAVEAAKLALKDGKEFDMQSYAEDTEGITVTVSNPEIEHYFYSDPWDTGSEKISASDGFISHQEELLLQGDLTGNLYSTSIKTDIEGEDGRYNLNDVSIICRNEKFTAKYSRQNSGQYSDYLLGNRNYDGLDLNIKSSGFKAFLGRVEGSPAQYIWDEENMEFDLIQNPTAGDYYALGLKKAFNILGLKLNTSLASRSNIESEEEYSLKSPYEDIALSVLGFNTAAQLWGTNIDFDLAYSIPWDKNQTRDTLIRLGLNKDIGLAEIDLKYRDSGHNFAPLDRSTAAFSSAQADYDKFTTGTIPGTSGINLTINPVKVNKINSSLVYAVVNDPSGDNSYKKKIVISRPFIWDGLTIGGDYVRVDNIDEIEETSTLSTEYIFLDNDAKLSFDYIKNNNQSDITRTTLFSGKYNFLRDKLTTYIDYQTITPEYDTAEEVEIIADKTLKTTELELDYNLNKYFKAVFGFEYILNNGHITKLEDKYMIENNKSFGLEVVDYQKDNLILNAGYYKEETEGYDIDYNQYTATIEPVVIDYTTNEYYFTLGYHIGLIEVTYDFSKEHKYGKSVDNGVYTTNVLEFDVDITDNTEFNVEYEALNLDADDKVNSVEDYKVETITAGVSIKF